MTRVRLDQQTQAPILDTMSALGEIPAVDEVPATTGTTESKLRALTGPLIAAGAGLAACTYVYLNNPNNGSSILPKCPLKYLTGIDCPGCGLTRAVYSLMHWDVVSAMSHNLLIIFFIPWLVMALVRWTAKPLGYDVPRLFQVKPWMVPAMVTGLAAFWILRNLPISPFDWFNSGYMTT